MKRILLVDGDIVIYKAAFGAEQVHQFDEDNWASSADINAAKDHFNVLVERLKDQVKADEVIIALTDAVNWRKAIYPTYKQQRSKVRRPLLLLPMKEYASEAFKCFVRPSLEADDVLGILATWDGMAGQKIIASIDKDLLQIPGRHINIDSGKKSVVTEAEGDYLHMRQTLTGDVVDSYPGCPGIGAKTADKLLTDNPTPWLTVVEQFEKKGLTEDDALVQARISRILRACNYDFVKKEPVLWQPPSCSS